MPPTLITATVRRSRALFSRFSAALLLSVALAVPQPVAATSSRIKDIADFEGIRENLLIGYGLVVGLNGTGDSLRNAPFTKQSLESMLERLGVNARNSNINTKNVAAVMVTANLGAFARQGTRLDINVSALGDAKNLLGGTLLVTPLVGADGEVYAVAQGPLAVGGFTAGGDAGSITKGVPTSARIPNGAIIEREIGFELASLNSMQISLRNPDLTTARRVASEINRMIGIMASRAIDPTTIMLVTPPSYAGRMVDLLTDIEQLVVETDQVARVVIDEQAGIIVMGKNVRVDEVAIAQGNLTVRVTETPQVSQPNAFSETGETVTVPRTEVDVDEGSQHRLTVLQSGVSLQDMVDGLNALGVGPRDLISILQNVKAAGALQAEIVVQ